MALTAQDQQNLMYLIVGALDAAPGRTIFNELAASYISGGQNAAALEAIADSIVAHPLFSDNTIGEYPISQTNAQFATEYAGSLLGARGTWVAGAAWDEAVAVMTSELNGGLSRADLILLAVNYMAGSGVAAPYQAAADALANKVEVALYQAVELELDVVGSNLDAYRAVLDGVDNTQASVDAAKDALFAEANTVNLTTGVDILTGNLFIARPAFTPGGDDFINTLQDEDELTGIGNNPTLNATLGGTSEEMTESEIAPILNNIHTLNIDWTQAGSESGVSAIDLQDASGLMNININRITDSTDDEFDLAIDNIASETRTIGIRNATVEADLEFYWREDELTGNETLDLALDRVRLHDLDLFETGDSSEDQGYFFETINIHVVGTSNIDEFDIDDNDEESNSQTVNLTADANTEINYLDIPGVDFLNITANADVVIADDEDDLLSTGNAGIDSEDLDLLTITGAGDVSIDGLNGASGADVNGATMTGDLTLGTSILGSSSSFVTSGSGNDTIHSYSGTLNGDVTTNAGNDNVLSYGDFGSPSAIMTGDGNDSVYGDDMNATADPQSAGNSSFGQATAAMIDTGSGNDAVNVDFLISATDWNNGDLLDSNVDDTWFVKGSSISTGPGSDSVSFIAQHEGTLINTGDDNDSVSVSLTTSNDDGEGEAVLGEDDQDSREVELDGDEDFLGAQLLLGSGDDVATFTNSSSFSYTDFIIVGRDALLDGGAGNDTLNVTVLDHLEVTDLYMGEEGDDNGDAFNTYIKGIETANLTISNQVDASDSAALADNDNDNTDGQIDVDVLRFDSALQNLNLISKEAPLETGPSNEVYEAGTSTDFEVYNMRDGVNLTLSANEATGVNGEGDLADDDDIDVYLDIDFADADGDNDSVTLNVLGPNVALDHAEDVDLDIDMNWTSSFPAGEDADTDYLVEHLTIDFQAGGSHFIDMDGFGDSQFIFSDENDGSFMQWRNQDPSENELLSEYNAIGDKTPFGQGFEVETSFTIADTEAGETITVEDVTADKIHITGDAAVDLTIGEDEGESFWNNYDIMTGTADDVVDMTGDLVDDEDTIDLGDGDNDRLIIRGDNSMGFSYPAQPENDEVWKNKHGIEILELVSNDGSATLVLDEEAFATGIRQIDVSGDADQDLTIVIGEDFDAESLTVNMGDELGNTALTIISSQDDILTSGEIYLNADGGASFTLTDDFNLIDINVIITVDTNSPTLIDSTNAGDADGEVEIDVTDGAIETITLVDPGNDTSAITITVADEWSSSELVIDMGGIANNDLNTATGGATVDGTLELDAELVVIGTANDDDITTSVENDTITAGAGDDIVDGGAGDDTIDGEAGNDDLTGGDGADDISGGTGDDIINGGDGADFLDGGSGDDTFVYDLATDSTGLSADTIDGFQAGSGNDVIDLSVVTGGTTFLGNFISFGVAVTALNGVIGEAFYVTNEEILYVDVDGDSDIDGLDTVIVMSGIVGTLVQDNFL